MKKLIALTFAAMLLTTVSIAQGAENAAALPVEGSWGVVMQDNGFSLDMTITLQNQMITTANVCTFQGRSARAAVTVPANYDDRTITVLGHGRQDVNQNGINCNVSVEPDRVNYELVGNSLILSKDGHSERFVLTRR